MSTRTQQIVLYPTLTLLLVLFLQLTSAYDFLYAEQFRLFRWAADYTLPFLTHAGGVVGLLDSFTLQYFAFPYCGAILTALMFLLMAVGTDLLLRGIAPKTPLPIFGIAIGLMQAGLATETFFSLEQTWAQIIMVWALIPFAYHHKGRWTWATAITTALLLYYLTGITAALAIVLMAVIVSRDGKTSLPTYGALTVSLALIAGLIWMASVKDVAHTWTLSAYYNNFATASDHSYFVPIALLAAVLTAVMLSDHDLQKRRQTITLAQIALGLVLGGWYFFLCHGGLETSRVKKLEVWRWEQDWNRILAEDMPTGSIPLYANYQNLALAATGQLGNEVITRSQCGTTGLQQVWQGMQQESDLLSDIFMQQGHVAMAQKMAFTAMQGNREQIHGRLMLRLIETNLILGADKVAEKYINILSQTLRYREEAEAYRKYVGHPDLVTRDPHMGELQRCTEGCDYCPNDLEEGLRQIIEANPAYRNALEYLGSYYLLGGNPENFRTFLNTYHDYPGLNPMPQSFERAAQSLGWHKPARKEDAQ